MRCRLREPAWCQQYCSWKAAGAAGTQPPLVPGPSARRRSCCGRTCGQRARPAAPGGAGARGALSSWKFLLASPERLLFGVQVPALSTPYLHGVGMPRLREWGHRSNVRVPTGSLQPHCPQHVASLSQTQPAACWSAASVPASALCVHGCWAQKSWLWDAGPSPAAHPAEWAEGRRSVPATRGAECCAAADPYLPQGGTDGATQPG